MSEYRVPLREMQFLIEGLSTGRVSAGLPPNDGAGADVVEAVLAEAARWAEEVLVPLYRVGDREGPKLREGHVQLPEVVRSAYSQFVAGGWCGLAFEEEWGGQNLPELIAVATSEIWKSANLAFASCPMLNTSAARVLREYGDADLQERFLGQLVSGDSTGTMNLTEPQAGSDLSLLRAMAEPEGDHYRVRAKKIFVTWGDHDLTDNILHLVLARTPDAPAGVKGISLFLVPKLIQGEDGGLVSNDITTVSIEEKLGLHLTPTCALSYGDEVGSVAYLVGEKNKGLVYMFTMMNHARLSVGVEGLAMAERAYQKAAAFARERIQGSSPGEEMPGPIVRHPDVRRMLMMMRACTAAMRALAYRAAFEVDVADASHDAEKARAAEVRLGILTPVVKAWCTELAQEIVSLGLQVHGGMGYIEETGAAQILRDVRVTSIYEGTTGIQANDLIGRKLIGDEARGVRALLDEVEALDSQLERGGESLARMRIALRQGVESAREAVDYILAEHGADENLAGAASVSFLMLLGTLLGGWQLAQVAARAESRLPGAAGEERTYLTAKLGTTGFYADHVMPRTRTYHASVMAGSASIMALSEKELEI